MDHNFSPSYCLHQICKNTSSKTFLVFFTVIKIKPTDIYIFRQMLQLDKKVNKNFIDNHVRSASLYSV